MSEPASIPEKTAANKLAKKWVDTWMSAGPVLERLRREELRTLDAFHSIENLLGEIDFTKEPFCPKPTSGLIQQQALFKKLKR